MIQTLELANTDNVNFNDNEVEVLKLNNDVIWKKIIADQLSKLIDGTITKVTAEDLEGVTSIGDYAFNDCTSLTKVTIPSSVTSIGTYAFYGCALTEITIPSSVTSIGTYAFNKCTALAEVTIPENITSIGGNVFRDCTALAEITIPSSVTSIGGSAFYGCTSLTEITIPENVTSIGMGAFNKCTALATVKVLAETPPTLNLNSIPNTVTRIEVPSASLSAYQSATRWTSFASIMVGV